MKLVKIISSVFLFAVVAAGSASAATCTLASLSGVYGVVQVGQDAPGQPSATVGQVTADGKGNLTVNFVTSSHNGAVSTGSDLSGSYTVAKNCTGTFTVVGGKNTSHGNIYLDTSNKTWRVAGTDAAMGVAQSFLTPQGTVTCGLTGKAQTFALNLSGTIVGTGPVGYVGQVTIDGKGGLKGTVTVSLNGTVTSGVALSGTYTEASTCLGTTQITAPGTLNLNTVVIDGGKQILQIETDNNTVVTGFIQ